MRKIEQQMVTAIAKNLNWHSGNTCVSNRNVYLHDNHIATVTVTNYQPSIEVNLTTLRNWPTATTKSRLRALGVNLTTKRGRIYIDGQAI
jgi:hypothetical protein